MSRNIIIRTLGWLTGYSGDGPLLRIEGPTSRGMRVRMHDKHGKPYYLWLTPDGFSSDSQDKPRESRNKAGSTGDKAALSGDIHARSYDRARKSNGNAPDIDHMMVMSNDIARKSGYKSAESIDMTTVPVVPTRELDDVIEEVRDIWRKANDLHAKSNDNSTKSRDRSITWWNPFSWLAVLWSLLWCKLNERFYMRTWTTAPDTRRYFEEADFDDLFELEYSEIPDARFNYYCTEVDGLECNGLVAYEVWLARYYRDRRLQLAFFLAYFQRLLKPLRRPAHQAQSWSVALARGIGSGPLFQRPPPVSFC